MTIIEAPDKYFDAVMREFRRRDDNPCLNGSPIEQKAGAGLEVTLAYDVGGETAVDMLVHNWENGIWVVEYDFRHNNISYDAKSTFSEPGNLFVSEVCDDIVYVLGRPIGNSFLKYEMVCWARSPQHKASPNSLLPGKYVFDIFNRESYRTLPRPSAILM